MVYPAPKRKPGRPRGSRTKTGSAGYIRRTMELKRRHGDGIFKRWGNRRGQYELG